MWRLVIQVLEARRSLCDELAREPTLEEVMARTEMPLKRLFVPLAIIQELRALSLPLDEVGTSQTLLMAIRVLSSLAPRKQKFRGAGYYVEGTSKEAGQGFSVGRETLERAQADMASDGEQCIRRILDSYVACGVLVEVGEQSSVTRERIREIEAKALRRRRWLRPRRAFAHRLKRSLIEAAGQRADE